MFKLIILILSATFIFIGCQASFEADSKPYLNGKTVGVFQPVAKSAANVATGDNQVSGIKTIKKPEVQFEDLKLELDIENPEVEGVINYQAIISVKLSGKMIRKGVTHKLNLDKKFKRFNSETREDYLETNEWAFPLKNDKKDFRFDVICKEKWDCKTIIGIPYWYDENKIIVKGRQYFIPATIQNNRLQAQNLTKNESDIENIEEDPEHEHSEKTDGQVSELRFVQTDVTKAGEFINDETVNSKDDQSESVISQIDKDINQLHTISPDRPISYQALDFADFADALKLEDILFDFKSKIITPFYANDLPKQAIGCHTRASSRCGESGKLKNAAELELIPYEKDVYGKVPYAIKGYEDNAHFATTPTVKLIESITTEIFENTGKTSILGDLSKKNGGQFGKHSSHTNGLDIDFMFFTTHDNYKYRPLKDNFKRFDYATNYLFLKTLYKKAQVYDQHGQSYSYLLFVLVHEKVKRKLCRYAKKTEPEELKNPSSDTYQLFRRLLVDRDGLHSDHYHIRLNCHTRYCQERADMNSTPGCG